MTDFYDGEMIFRTCYMNSWIVWYKEDKNERGRQTNAKDHEVYIS